MSLHAIILTTWHLSWRFNGQWVLLTASRVQIDERKVNDAAAPGQIIFLLQWFLGKGGSLHTL